MHNNTAQKTSKGLKSTFCHRGAASAGGNRHEATSTGLMLTGPFNPAIAENKPMPPPPMFRSKTDVS
ncbi:hypothetical protein KUTeg_004949 [Tegillarca granosa]|uniref:Uncharacterized protein n=1 Tax=Tegillarca granosa TaxID=220873 RepID=A0ABQ9FID3_TEGGR|nr:hypothetical protein KUTeg_004949 [Tegillarca granosa]